MRKNLRINIEDICMDEKNDNAYSISPHSEDECKSEESVLNINEIRPQMLTMASDLFDELKINLDKSEFKEERLMPYIRLIDGNNYRNWSNVVCDICQDDDVYIKNNILICNLCFSACHKTCYGGNYSDSMQNTWTCARCQHLINHNLPYNAVKCFLCPQSDLKGLMKKAPQTESYSKNLHEEKWVHLDCINWIPEIYFADIKKEKVILKDLNGKRFTELTCSICMKKEGACIQCDYKDCMEAFHVRCAKRKEYIKSWQEMKRLYTRDYIPVYCAYHYLIVNSGKNTKSLGRKRNRSPSSEVDSKTAGIIHKFNNKTTIISLSPEKDYEDFEIHISCNDEDDCVVVENINSKEEKYFVKASKKKIIEDEDILEGGVEENQIIGNKIIESDGKNVNNANDNANFKNDFSDLFSHNLCIDLNKSDESEELEEKMQMLQQKEKQILKSMDQLSVTKSPTKSKATNTPSQVVNNTIVNINTINNFGGGYINPNKKTINSNSNSIAAGTASQPVLDNKKLLNPTSSIKTVSSPILKKPVYILKKEVAEKLNLNHHMPVDKDELVEMILKNLESVMDTNYSGDEKMYLLYRDNFYSKFKLTGALSEEQLKENIIQNINLYVMNKDRDDSKTKVVTPNKSPVSSVKVNHKTDIATNIKNIIKNKAANKGNITDENTTNNGIKNINNSNSNINSNSNACTNYVSTIPKTKSTSPLVKPKATLVPRKDSSLGPLSTFDKTDQIDEDTLKLKIFALDVIKNRSFFKKSDSLRFMKF